MGASYSNLTFLDTFNLSSVVFRATIYDLIRKLTVTLPSPSQMAVICLYIFIACLNTVTAPGTLMMVDVWCGECVKYTNTADLILVSR